MERKEDILKEARHDIIIHAEYVTQYFSQNTYGYSKQMVSYIIW